MGGANGTQACVDHPRGEAKCGKRGYSGVVDGSKSRYDRDDIGNKQAPHRPHKGECTAYKWVPHLDYLGWRYTPHAMRLGTRYTQDTRVLRIGSGYHQRGFGLDTPEQPLAVRRVATLHFGSLDPYWARLQVQHLAWKFAGTERTSQGHLG